MQHRKIIIPVCVLGVIVAAALFVRPRVMGRKPFAELKAENIASASVQLLPPDTTVQITDMGELATALNDVVVYDQDDSWTEYNGQAVIYTIILNDGKEITVIAYNPFIIIDGIGYKTKYGPCERLSQIANKYPRG